MVAVQTRRALATSRTDEAGQTRAVVSLLYLGKKGLQMRWARTVSCSTRPPGFAASIP
jgi:hypothetical protein